MEVVVGRLGRAHGIRGEVTLDARTDVPERRFVPGAVMAADGRELTLQTARPHAGRWLVRFSGISDRTAAETLGGLLLLAEVPDDETTGVDDEFFDRQLIGLAVVSDGTVVGVIVDIVHSTAQDTLVIEIDGHEVLVPFVAALVEVDIEAGRVIVADRPGLLEPDTAESDRQGS